MKILYVNMYEPIDMNCEITACIGYFDGLHKGHQALIQKVLEVSKRDGTIPALISFEPDPWTVLRNIDHPPHIMALEDRCAVIEEMGIRLCIILQFDKTMADLQVEEFHHRILHALHVKTLVCGYDFHYGIRGSGSVETLREQSQFRTEVIEQICDSNQKISSTRIEELIRDGDMEKAEELLTRPFGIRGTIIKGNQIGRTYGFPTANLRMLHAYVCPKRGVYIGAVLWKDAAYPAIINVGYNPTFNHRERISIEAHILDFHEDLYGENCCFYFYKYIRDERKLPSKQDLIDQLARDRQTAAAYFKEKRSI